MYSISKTINRNDETVIYKTKNESGQILDLTFYLNKYSDTDVWWIVFWMGKRKKGFQYNTQTGKDGLKSLLWAKECIKDFILNSDKHKKTRLALGWTDKRRREIYKWGLKDIGFLIKREDKLTVLTLDLK
jgi:hypothetical protein